MTGRDVRETLGLLGVIGSLIFVGLEIRQNTQVARAEAYRGIEQSISAWTLATVEDAEVAAALRRVTFEGARRDELTDTEKWQVGAMYDVPLRILESIYRQVGEGILPESALDYYGETSYVYTAPYMRDLWPVIKPNYHADFAEYFEQRFQIDG